MDSFFSVRPISPPNPSFFNPILRRTFANGYRNDPYGSYTSARMAIRTIIGLNTAVFGTWYYARSTKDSKLLQWLNENFTLSMVNYREGRYWTLLTSAFSHQNFVHFLFNMFAFNAFGSILAFVPGVGAGHIVSLCLGSAITGSFAFLYTHGIMDPPSNSKVPNAIVGAGRIQFSALGASGMIMGAGLAATCLMPRAPMSLLFPPVTLPLWALMGIYVGIDLYFLGDVKSKIGHDAHIGGAVYGAMYYFGNLRKYGGVWSMVRRLFRR
jgi:membrane associated rhomboid family serine protease